MTDKPLAKEHPLKLFNSLTREVERFKPQDPSRVTMYNCGPTVYSYAHIGNARAAVVADVLFRVLRHIYGEEHVVYARNLTDVDDKIIKAVAETGEDMASLTERYARIYNEDLTALNCLPPTHQPKATGAIQEMADIIVELLDKDVAYVSEGHVLFDVTKDDDYGKLSGRKLDDNRAGARVEVASYKRNPGDFVLWKPSKDGEPSWNPSDRFPPGRPGWHIECSAMIRDTLGETIDIHCGGIDLKFPHHENEIAQSECANDKPLAKFWVHNEFLNMGKDKMSKSEGNVVLVHDLLEEWDGEVIRLALLKAHYRSELSWSEDLLRESKAQLDGWYRLLANKPAKPSDGVQSSGKFDHLSDAPSLHKQIEEAVSIDLLLAAVWSLLSTLQEKLSLVMPIVGAGRVDLQKQATLSYYDEALRLLNLMTETLNLLGLLQRDPDDWFSGNASDDDKARFDALAEARAAARKAKNWAEADRIRDEGTAAGIVFEDGPERTSWRKA